MTRGAEIAAYLNKVVDLMDLRKYMRFNTELLSAVWDDNGFWNLRVRRALPEQEPVEEMLQAEILVNNSGTQDKFQYPDIPGLSSFRGKVRIQELLATQCTDVSASFFIPHAGMSLLVKQNGKIRLSRSSVPGRQPCRWFPRCRYASTYNNRFLCN